MDNLIFFIIFIFIPIIILITLFKTLQYKRNPLKKVQCWFCSKIHFVLKEFKNSWECPFCEQYNGFNEDGGYNRLIRAQHYSTSNTRKRYAECNAFNSGDRFSNGLCDTCNANENHKISCLNNFSPRNKRNYEDEHATLRDNLERVYPLCRKCQHFLNKKIKADQSLLPHTDDSTTRIADGSPFKTNVRLISVSLAALNFILSVCCLVLDHSHVNHLRYFEVFPANKPTLCRYITNMACLLSVVILYQRQDTGNCGWSKFFTLPLPFLWFGSIIYRHTYSYQFWWHYCMDVCLTIFSALKLFNTLMPASRRTTTHKFYANQNGHFSNSFDGGYVENDYNKNARPKPKYDLNNKFGSFNISRLEPATTSNINPSNHVYDRIRSKQLSSSVNNATFQHTRHRTSNDIAENFFLRKPKLNVTPPQSQRVVGGCEEEYKDLHNRNRAVSHSLIPPSPYPTNNDGTIFATSSSRIRNQISRFNGGSCSTDDAFTSSQNQLSYFNRLPNDRHYWMLMQAAYQANPQTALHHSNYNIFVTFVLGLCLGVNSICAWLFFRQNIGLF